MAAVADAIMDQLAADAGEDAVVVVTKVLTQDVSLAITGFGAMTAAAPVRSVRDRGLPEARLWSAGSKSGASVESVEASL